MALTVKFATPAIVITDTGHILVNFDDGNQMEFDDADSMRNAVLAALPTVDNMRTIAIAQRLAADPLMDSPTLWNGKVVTLDVEQANPAATFKVV